MERGQGKFEKTRECYERALPLYGQLREENEKSGGGQEVIDVYDIDRGLASCLHRLGDVTHLSKGKDIPASLEWAANLYKGALELYKKIGDGIGQGNCQKGFADVAVARGEFTRGYTCCSVAKEKYQECGDKGGTANCAYSIGDIKLRLGQAEEAMNA